MFHLKKKKNLKIVSFGIFLKVTESKQTSIDVFVVHMDGSVDVVCISALHVSHACSNQSSDHATCTAIYSKAWIVSSIHYITLNQLVLSEVVKCANVIVYSLLILITVAHLGLPCLE